jgi:hypothetical protein
MKSIAVHKHKMEDVDANLKIDEMPVEVDVELPF